MNPYQILAKGFQLAAKGLQELHYIILRDKVLEDYFTNRVDMTDEERENNEPAKKAAGLDQTIREVIMLFEKMSLDFSNVKIEPKVIQGKPAPEKENADEQKDGQETSPEDGDAEVHPSE